MVRDIEVVCGVADGCQYRECKLIFLLKTAGASNPVIFQMLSIEITALSEEAIQSSNLMSDRELYNLIVKLIHEKKQQTTEMMSFAESYCKKELTKKKLISFNSNQKMRQIMKNFKTAGPNIDIQAIINDAIKSVVAKIRAKQCLNATAAKNEEDETNLDDSEKQAEEKPLRGRTFKRNPLSKNQFQKNNQNASRTQVDCWVKQGYLGHNEPFLDKMVSWLNTENHLESNHSNGLVYLMHNINQLEKCSREGMPNSTSISRGIGNLSSPVYEPSHVTNQSIFNDIKTESAAQNNKPGLSFQERKEYIESLHKITSYLQIALQYEHTKRWQVKKDSKAPKQDEPFAKAVKFGNIVQSQLTSPSEIKPLLKNKYDKNKFQGLSQQPSGATSRVDSPGKENAQPSKPNLFKRSVHTSVSRRGPSNKTVSFPTAEVEKGSQGVKKNSFIKDSYTFRSRSIKTKIITKLAKFVETIENQQYESKTSNKQYQQAIDRLEKNLTASFSQLGETRFLAEPQDFSEAINQNQSESFKKHHKRMKE